MKTKKVDVLVCGAGTAGIVAALAAARNGAQTLVVDKLRCLGGQFTAGMQGCWVGFSDKEKVIVKGIAWDIRDRLIARGAYLENDVNTDVCYIYDTEASKIVLDEMVAEEKNLEVYLDTLITGVVTDGDAVKGIIALSECEEMEITADVVVDCTGDAVVSYMAGVPYEIRDKENIQPCTLMGKLGGVDIEKVKKFYAENPPVIDTFLPPAWRSFKTLPGFMHYGLGDELAGDDVPERLHYLRHWLAYFNETPNFGEVVINCSGAIINHSTSGFSDRTSMEISAEKCLYDVAEVYKRYVPGFEKSFVSGMASLLGIRETRRIIGDYKVTFEDFLSARQFEDNIGLGAMPAGYHKADGSEDMDVFDLEPGTSMGIPYRCMLPLGKDGLLVAGRCSSYEPEVANCIRCMAQVMAMGEAAGTAAAIAAKKGIQPRDVDIKELQAQLKKQNAIF